MSKEEKKPEGSEDITSEELEALARIAPGEPDDLTEKATDEEPAKEGEYLPGESELERLRLENAKKRARKVVEWYQVAIMLKDERLIVDPAKYDQAETELAPAIMKLGADSFGALPPALVPYEPYIRAGVFGLGMAAGTMIQLYMLRQADLKASQENASQVNEGESEVPASQNQPSLDWDAKPAKPNEK